MHKNFVNILQQMVAKETKEAILNPAKCKAFIKDYARGEYKKEIKWLLSALDEKVQIAINDTDDLQNCKLVQVKILKDECGFSDDIATNIVDMLAFVLRGNTTKTVKQQEKKEEPPVKQPIVQPVQNDDIIVRPKEKSIITFGAYQWLVLDEQNDKKLIITQDIVKKMRFHGSSNVYKNSEVRKYLINDFYNSFNAQEKARILHDPETNDNIFLLSRKQAENYFTSDKERKATSNGWACFWWLRTPGIYSHSACFVWGNGSISVGGTFKVSGNGGTVRPALWLKL